jgi:ribose 5-phosphate isomerase B
VIAFGARLIGPDMANACVAAFLDSAFAGWRHQRRVDLLSHALQDSD